MKLAMSHYIIGFPIQLYGIEDTPEGYKVTFINPSLKHIEHIRFKLDKSEVKQEINQSSRLIDCFVQSEIHLIQGNFAQIIAATIDGKTYEAKAFEAIIVSPHKSVHGMGYEKSLYQHDLAELVGRPKKEVEFVAENNPYYWNCVCGHTNLAEDLECQNCGINKEKLFSKQISVSREAKQTQRMMLILRNLLIWMIVIIFSQTAYQSLTGDFLFTNNLKNQFLGVMNRIVLPSLLIVLLVTAMVSKLRYKKTYFILSIIGTLAIYFYLNIMTAVYFVGSSYNFILVVAMNIGIAGIFIYNYRQKIKSLLISALMLSAIIFSINGILQYQVFGQYNITIENDGIHLTVQTTETTYTIPETIGGIEVTSIIFPKSQSYPIQDLIISQYVQHVYYYSALVLGELQTISVVDNNPYFYVEDNILYKEDGTIEMVPISIQSLYIDDDTIAEGPFKNLVNLKSLTIGKDVYEIEMEAFIGATSLESITFEDHSTIRIIGDRAFANAASLVEIEFPVSLRTLGIGVLEGATSLERLTAPFIGHERERSTDLASSTDILVYFFGSNTYLHNNLVPASLTYVEFYDITMIHNVTFYRDSYLVNIVLSSPLTQLGVRSFYGTTSLVSFSIPSGVTSIPEYCFEGSGIQSIIIPATVTYVSANAFKDTNLQSIIYLGDYNNLVVEPTGNDSLIQLLP